MTGYEPAGTPSAVCAPGESIIAATQSRAKVHRTGLSAELDAHNSALKPPAPLNISKIDHRVASSMQRWQTLFDMRCNGREFTWVNRPFPCSFCPAAKDLATC